MLSKVVLYDRYCLLLLFTSQLIEQESYFFKPGYNGYNSKNTCPRNLEFDADLRD